MMGTPDLARQGPTRQVLEGWASGRIRRGSGPAALSPPRMASRRNGRDVGQQMQPEAAQRLHGQEIDQQRTVEEIDRDGAGKHVAGARGMIGLEHLGPADVLARRPSGADALGEGRRVAQSKVEPWAPIGGMTCADSPTRATRLAPMRAAVRP